MDERSEKRATEGGPTLIVAVTKKNSRLRVSIKRFSAANSTISALNLLRKPSKNNTTNSKITSCKSFQRFSQIMLLLTLF